MKTSKSNSLIILALYSQLALAEVDSFDMSLTGEFTTDYCELSTNFLFDFDIDIGSIYKQKKENEYVLVGAKRVYLNCSGGLYDIEISKTSPTEDSDTGDGLLYRHNAHSYTGERLIQPGVETRPNGLSLSTPYRLRNVEFHPVFGGVAKFNVTTFAFPKEGNWNDLPDSFNHTEAIIVAIDKKG